MSRTEVDADQIAEALRELGVGPGELLLVHSSLSSFGWVDGGAEAVIDALLEAVQPQGTVLVPTHTWDRIGGSNVVFDVRRMPSGVGRITEVFRNRPDAWRGLHPTHSCAGIGPETAAMLSDHEKDITPCGPRSPYQRLIRRPGKIALLGVSLFVNTSFHALEEMACVPWAFDRFAMLYTVDHDGRRRQVPSRLHSRGMKRDFEKMEPVLEDAGVLKKTTVGQATVRVVDASGMAEVCLPMLAEDPFVFLASSPAKEERRRYEQWSRRRRW